MSGARKLSIVIPACNEEDRLIPTLDAYEDHFMPRYGDDIELIVVVNGSIDRTAELALEYATRCPNVRVIVEPIPIGKGGAISAGFRVASGSMVGFTDADGATPPHAFQDLVDNIRDAGAIIASRWLKGAEVSPKQPLSRRVASRLFNLIVRILFGLRITDTQCGAKLIRRDALLDVLPKLGITKWAFDVDLLWNLRAAGYAIVEIPTVWHDVKGSKVNVPRASVEMMLALSRFRLIHSPFRWIVQLYDRAIGRWIHRRV